jgi:branched-subunit amino acid transport protein AzlD
MAMPTISFAGAMTRIGAGIALVLGTFNPTGYSLFHWITAAPVGVTPGKALASLALVIAWFLCLRTAFVSLGKIGLLLGLALFGALVWFLVDQDILSLAGSAIVWVGLVIVGLLLGIGLSWSLVRAKVTGQIETQ